MTLAKEFAANTTVQKNIVVIVLIFEIKRMFRTTRIVLGTPLPNDKTKKRFELTRVVREHFSPEIDRLMQVLITQRQ